jgi:hypothetical protein
MEPARFERDETGLAEIDRLLETTLGEVPEVESGSVAPRRDVVRIEALLVGVGLTKLRREERVLPRLVPEVVVEGRRLASVFPAALQVECLRIEHREAAGAISVGIAEHRDDDVVAGHAVHRVRARVAGCADDLFGLDDPFDLRPARVVCDVEHVDARGAETRHDQVGAVGPVARRAAAVPAVVMQFVADVRHRRLVHDPAVFGIDNGDEVGGVHTCPLVQAGEVQELFGRRLHRLLRRAMEGRRPDLVVRHRTPFGALGSGRHRATAVRERSLRPRLSRTFRRSF